MGITENRGAGGGRNMLGIVIDEAKQLARKKLNKGKFTIYIMPVTEGVREYYLESGFREKKGSIYLYKKAKQ